MASEKCIHPDCECLDYCEALDPFSPTPTKRKENVIDNEKAIQEEIHENG